MLLRRPNALFRRFSTQTDFDVIVIGGGHAGCEGAAAAARCGARTALLTHNKNTIGEMSCNPSFGGIGKGHLVREIDALDGICARICDQSAITYQALNRSQGPAVIGLRAQIDRSLYKQAMQKEIFSTTNLEVLEANVEELITEEDSNRLKIKNVVLSDGRKISSKCVIITTGTFLGGEIFLGLKRWKAGRIGEQSSLGLSESFTKLGFKLGRLRTGTPPRILKDTIDFSKFLPVPPDSEPIPFSFLTEKVWLEPKDQLPTYLGETNDRVTELVEAHLKENEHVTSETTGPRYCPSLESKVIRFRHLKHRTYLEREGLDSPLVYPQGMSMTFSPEIQQKIMRAIPGLEKVEVAQPGYGVQYDFVDPQQLFPTLETKKVGGLLLAGQINGTTGYEEAAAQGILAGINAAAIARGEPGMTIKRSEGYIGVLVDDLTSLGTNEPYRMFTSRAECRLHLRPDNADMRLTALGRQYNAVSDARWDHFLSKKHQMDEVTETLKGITMSVSKWSRLLPKFDGKKAAKVHSAYDMIYRHDVHLSDLIDVFPDQLNKFRKDSNQLTVKLRTEGSYSVEHRRLQAKVAEIDREAQTLIPEDINYGHLTGLSMECMEKLEKARPQNLAAASRIPGITPEAIITILRYLKKGRIALKEQKIA